MRGIKGIVGELVRREGRNISRVGGEVLGWVEEVMGRGLG